MTDVAGVSSDFRVTMLLCNYAVVSDGMLHVNGGGWTQIDPHAAQTAIALILGVPWSESNRRIVFTFKLLDEDGHPQDQAGIEDSSGIFIQGQFEVGRPAGHTPGGHIDWPVAILVPPLQLPSGSRLSWVLEIDGKSRPEWNLPFTTR